MKVRLSAKTVAALYPTTRRPPHGLAKEALKKWMAEEKPVRRTFIRALDRNLEEGEVVELQGKFADKAAPLVASGLLEDVDGGPTPAPAKSKASKAEAQQEG